MRVSLHNFTSYKSLFLKIFVMASEKYDVQTSATRPRSPFLTTSFLIFCTLLPVAPAMALMSSESPIPSSVPS